MREAIGLTDEILEEIQNTQKKEDPPKTTELYQDLMTVKELGMSIKDFHHLSRIDKKILYYFRVMESYLFESQMKKMKKKADQDRQKQENERKTMSQMPKLSMARFKARR